MASVMSYNEQQKATLERLCNVMDSRSDFLIDPNNLSLWEDVSSSQDNDSSQHRIASDILLSGISCGVNEDCGYLRLGSNMKSNLVLLTATDEYQTPRNKLLSEENNHRFVSQTQCDYNYFVTKVECRNQCDNIKLLCRRVKVGVGILVHNDNTHETDWQKFSADVTSSQTRKPCQTNYYVIGLRCRNSRCGQVKVICRRIEVCI